MKLQNYTQVKDPSKGHNRPVDYNVADMKSLPIWFQDSIIATNLLLVKF